MLKYMKTSSDEASIKITIVFQPGVDACTGDGGGPLVCPLAGTPGTMVQVGNVTFYYVTFGCYYLLWDFGTWIPNLS